jgi:hypothetical protein
MRKLTAFMTSAFMIVALALSGVMTTATPASAARPTVSEQVQHYLECLAWLFTDPAAHEKYCSPASEYVDPWPKDNGDGSDDCKYERFVGYVQVVESCCNFPTAFVQVGLSCCDVTSLGSLPETLPDFLQVQIDPCYETQGTFYPYEPKTVELLI